MDVSNNSQDKISLKGEHLEHNFRWGLSEQGIVVVVMGSSMLRNRDHFYLFSC